MGRREEARGGERRRGEERASVAAKPWLQEWMGAKRVRRSERAGHGGGLGSGIGDRG